MVSKLTLTEVTLAYYMFGRLMCAKHFAIGIMINAANQSLITVGTFASGHFLTYCLNLPRHALKYTCTSPCLYSQLLCSLIYMYFR